MNTLQEVNVTIDAARKQMKIRDAIKRLQHNDDFKLVINEEFLVFDCARNIKLTTDTGITEAVRTASLEMARSAGYLQTWFEVQIAMGNAAEAAIEDNENFAEELRQEGLED